MPEQSLHKIFSSEAIEALKEEKCPGKTWEQIAAEAEARRKRIMRKQYEEWMEGQLRKTGVPEMYLAAAPSKPFSMQWSENPTDGLYIWGRTGAGKTWEAAGIVLEHARRAIALSHTVSLGNRKPRGRQKFTTFAAILDQCYDLRRDEVLKDYIDYDLLVLDDLGKEKPSEYTLETLYRLINGRIENGKATIITSNLKPDELVRLFTIDGGRYTGDALSSRLSTFRIVNLTGEDRRLS